MHDTSRAAALLQQGEEAVDRLPGQVRPTSLLSIIMMDRETFRCLCCWRATLAADMRGCSGIGLLRAAVWLSAQRLLRCFVAVTCI
jgi:hypothetical protein